MSITLKQAIARKFIVQFTMDDGTIRYLHKWQGFVPQAVLGPEAKKAYQFNFILAAKRAGRAIVENLKVKHYRVFELTKNGDKKELIQSEED